MRFRVPQAQTIETVVSRSRMLLLFAWFGQAMMLVAALVAIVIMASVLISDQKKIETGQKKTAADTARIEAIRNAICDTQYAVATSQPPPNSHELAVTVIESNRKGFVIAGCPGKLPPPPARLVELGKKFGVPITY